MNLTTILSACVCGLLFQLERADEGNVNGDFAVALMEGIGAELQELDEEDMAEFMNIIRQLEESEADLAKKQFLKDFAANFGLSS